MAQSDAKVGSPTQSSTRQIHDYPERVYVEYPDEQGLMPGTQPFASPHGANSWMSLIDSPSGESALPSPWFRSGFKPLVGDGEISNTEPANTGLQFEENRERSARQAPELHVAENSTGVGPQLDEDGSTRRNLLQRWVFDDIQPSRLETGGHPARSRATGARVLIRRMPKSNESGIEALRREIAALKDATDPSIATYHESPESDSALWSVLEYTPGHTIRQYVQAHGPQPVDVIKSLTTQLFSGLAAIFVAGFAHLRICDETILVNSHGQLIIDNFQFAFPYGDEKVDNMYAVIEDKCGDDIYVAPEVFASIKYNARKAVIWSCGVVLYFIAAGTTSTLSVLNHPSFDDNTSTTPDPDHIPRSPLKSQSRRKLSTASQQALKVPLIPYPRGRHTVPSWTRDIISKMLQVEPRRRAELIEVAAKVPKEFYGKDARPLMELAWLDYKSHVGPNAGLHEGTDDEDKGSLFSFSGMSAFSRESLGALIPGRRRSTNAKVSAPAELGTSSSFRRKSTWL